MIVPSLERGLLAAGSYVALIAAASLYTFQITDAPTNAAGALSALLPFQLLAVGLCILGVIRGNGWRAAGFGRVNWRALVWLLPSFVVLGLMVSRIVEVVTWEQLLALGTGGVVLFVVTPFLIAFGEEVIFRGVLLRGAMSSLPVMQAMLLSALCFGLFHLVNGIAGQGVSGTAQHVAFALLVGLYLAPIAVRIGNLWPLIIWHWLWNVAVYFSQLADLFHPFVLVGIAMQAVISIWLWTDLIRLARTA